MIVVELVALVGDGFGWSGGGSGGVVVGWWC